MIQRVRAIFRDGAFVPRRPLELPDNTEVELLIETPTIHPPRVVEPVERRRILEQLTERMRENPLPAECVPFRRDQLHERRCFNTAVS